MQGMQRWKLADCSNWERSVALDSELQTGQLWRRLARGLKERFRSTELENKPRRQLEIVTR